MGKAASNLCLENHDNVFCKLAAPICSISTSPSVILIVLELELLSRQIQQVQADFCISSCRFLSWKVLSSSGLTYLFCFPPFFVLICLFTLKTTQQWV